MKCVVCGKTFNNKKCPICGFPVLVVPEAGRVEDALREKENIELVMRYRRALLSKLRVSWMAYYWQDKSGKIELNRCEKIVIGSGSQLYGETVWSDKKCARIPDPDSVDVEFTVEYKVASGGDEEKKLKVSIPNLKNHEPQNIGVSLGNAIELTAYLKNTQQQANSVPISLFD